jgi:hypothetical protein
MKKLTEIDLLTTHDQTLIEIARLVVEVIETGSVKIVDLSKITPDNRFIRIKLSS